MNAASRRGSRMHRAPLTFLATLLLVCPIRLLRAQTADSIKSAKTKEWEVYSRQLQELKKSGRAAYSNEEKREKAGDCPKAATTYDINVCLGDELDKTTANLKTYTDSLRSVEDLSSPGAEDETGPTGKPPTRDERIKEFDKVEAAWHAYYDAQCSAAYNAYKGGTIAPAMQLTCRLQLTRDRLHELESIYQLMH